MDVTQDEPASSLNGGEHERRAASALRREILVQLRQAGALSPDRLAERVGLSRTGVLQQLRALETAGLVSRQTVRHGVGRPRHLYDVTEVAQDLFPNNYGALAEGLLKAIRAVGGDDLIEQVFQARRLQLGERMREHLRENLPPDAPLPARARELAVVQDAQGYLCQAGLDGDGVVRLREHNCAIYHIAASHPSACKAELELFEDVLGVRAVRESHIATGDRSCTYRLVEPTVG